jgi:hypothetical protein
MSRSRRKTPITGITTAESEKKDKRIANRNLRRTSRTAIQKQDSDEIALPILREVRNVWGMQKDGKQFFDSKKHPKLMRK